MFQIKLPPKVTFVVYSSAPSHPNKFNCFPKVGQHHFFRFCLGLFLRQIQRTSKIWNKKTRASNSWRRDCATKTSSSARGWPRRDCRSFQARRLVCFKFCFFVCLVGVRSRFVRVGDCQISNRFIVLYNQRRFTTLYEIKTPIKKAQFYDWQWHNYCWLAFFLFFWGLCVPNQIAARSSVFAYSSSFSRASKFTISHLSIAIFSFVFVGLFILFKDIVRILKVNLERPQPRTQKFDFNPTKI